MLIFPPPFYGAWPEERGRSVSRKATKKSEILRQALSNFDLENWCEYLNIPIKNIFTMNHQMKSDHNPCIINMDYYGSQGTHWVCCNHDKARKTVEYVLWVKVKLMKQADLFSLFMC